MGMSTSSKVLALVAASAGLVGAMEELQEEFDRLVTSDFPLLCAVAREPRREPRRAAPCPSFTAVPVTAALGRVHNQPDAAPMDYG